MPTRCLGPILAAVLALGVARDTGAAGTATGDDRLGLTYEVYSGGFHVLTVDLDLLLAPRRYDVTTRLRTAGMLGWLVSWSQVSESEGRVGRDGLAPVRHRSRGEFRGAPRSVEIDYEAGQVSAVRVHPPRLDDDERDTVTEAQRREAVDPMSAILGAIHALSAGEPCQGRLQIFDGRRRYDLVLTDRGTRVLQESRIAAFAGEAVQCDFRLEPVAGHIRQSDPDSPEKRRIRSGRVFAARAGGPLVTPVRVEIDGDWGDTIAHLSAVRGAAAPR